MIEQKLAAAALKEVDTANFERFAQTLYGAMQDWEFVALGGMHDGGAEGLTRRFLDRRYSKLRLKAVLFMPIHLAKWLSRRPQTKS